MKFTGRNLTTLAILSLLSLFTGCGGGGSSSSGSDTTGTLSLSLQDATTEDYWAVYVTIDRVEVHMGGDEGRDSNWTNVLSSDKAGKTYNLLDLVNGVREELGIVDLPAGHYTQMRLIIGRKPDDINNVQNQNHPYANYVITKPDFEVYELKVPSGFQTGLKIVHGFDVSENQTTELVLDFDAPKSVVKAGNSGNWMLKPTVKVLEEYAIVRGTVTVKEGGTRIPGVLVSAQQLDDNGNPVVYAATITEDNGSYVLFLDPDRDGDGIDDLYTIVAYKKGYDAGCTEVITSPEMNQAPGTTSVTMAGPKATGTLTGEIAISGGSADQYVTLSFRQEKGCTSAVSPPGTQQVYIEVAAENYVNGGYSIGLTEGTYDVNASTYNPDTDQPMTDELVGLQIADGDPQTWDIALPAQAQ